MTCFAQEQKEQRITIDAYIGSSKVRKVIKLLDEIPEALINIHTSSIGPLGLRFEYKLDDRMAIGINTNILKSSASTSYFDKTDNRDYFLKLSVIRLRVMPTFTYHFMKHKIFDPYFQFGLGYSYHRLKFETDSPKYKSKTFDFELSPAAVRVEGGCRIFPWKNFGFTIGIGAGGGPVVIYGLAGRF